MSHLTKIVATIGPSSESEKMISRLIESGVDVFRFNLKHNDLAWHAQKISAVKKIAADLNKNIGILADLQGPEIRVRLTDRPIKVNKGQLVELGSEAFTISHPQISEYLRPGQHVLIEDGLLEFSVVKSKGKVFLESLGEGTIYDKKNFNIPGADFPIPVLEDRDVAALEMISKNDVDFVALSFVRDTNDVSDLKKEMARMKIGAKVIAKIETEVAIKNLGKIAEIVDGLMVARGDLGVEISLEKVPYYQKEIIKTARKKNIFVITATQMLQSMIDRSSPTRAEVSDVAGAFYDRTDAVMLSAETATGHHVEAATKYMSKILSFSEEHGNFDTKIPVNPKTKDRTDLICESAFNLYTSLIESGKKTAGFLVFTQSGKTARSISRYHPLLPIYAFVSDKKVADSLSVNYGVKTFLHPAGKDEVTKEDILKAIRILLDKNFVKKDMTLVVLHGDYWAVTGGTSTVRVINV